MADWRKARMDKIRALIKQADPDVIEEQKYKMPSNPVGIPVWYHDGMICTGETYKEHLRFTFSKGSKLKDPKGVLNKYTALVIKENDKLNEAAFKALIREAVEFNRNSGSVARRIGKSPQPKRPTSGSSSKRSR